MLKELDQIFGPFLLLLGVIGVLFFAVYLVAWLLGPSGPEHSSRSGSHAPITDIVAATERQREGAPIAASAAAVGQAAGSATTGKQPKGPLRMEASVVSSVTADCAADSPKPATPEEAELTASGRRYLTGRNARLSSASGEFFVVEVALDFDGQCLPDPTQVYVYLNGKQAGTLSPSVMGARSDQSIVSFGVVRDDFLRVSVSRYLEDDPLCCPSSIESYMVSLGALVEAGLLKPDTHQVDSKVPGQAGNRAAPVAPSFDCRKATTPSELTICGSPELAELDGRLGLAYRELLTSLSDAKARELRSRQIGWIKKRDVTCRGEASCLADVLRLRLEEFQTINDVLGRRPEIKAY